MQLKSEYVELGTIARSHGVKGCILAQISADTDSSLKYLNEVYVDGVVREIEDRAWMPKGWQLKFVGINTKEEAEKLRGLRITALRGDLEDPEEGSFYLHDIMGARATAADDKKFEGRLESVDFLPGQDVWWIRTKGTVLGVPANRKYIVDVKRGENPHVILKNLRNLV